MSARLTVLEKIRIASPCGESWEHMTGDDRRRFCARCRLHVHNLSAMSEAEILRLVERTGGRLCGRFFLRRDGTILTRDCPVGTRALRRTLAAGLGAIAAALAFALGLFATVRPGTDRTGGGGAATVTAIEPLRTLQRWIAPTAAPPPRFIMGEIACPPPAGGGSTAAGTSGS